MCNNKVLGRKYIFLQPDDDRRFREFAVQTGHDPNGDAGVVCRVRLVRAGWCGCDRGLNASRKKRPGGATSL